MSEQHQQGPDIVKWYTRARRFPQLIGRTTDGARIPFGPYTVTQAVGGGLILVVGLNTMGLWARFGLLGNILMLGTVTWSVVWLLGRIPVGSRNPLSVATGIAHAIGAPATGRLGGRAVRIRRPHQLRHTVVLTLTDTTPVASADRDILDETAVTMPSAVPIGGVSAPKKLLGALAIRPRPLEARPASRSPESRLLDSPAALGPRRAPLTRVQALLASHPTATSHRRTEMET
ncbi:MAG: hypothetical protein ACRCYU_01825 [Nocardioides sp.]